MEDSFAGFWNLFPPSRAVYKPRAPFSNFQTLLPPAVTRPYKDFIFAMDCGLWSNLPSSLYDHLVYGRPLVNFFLIQD